METAAFQHFMDQLGEPGEDILEMIDRRFETASVCGHCSDTKVRKWGSASGLKRYRCKQCGRMFNALTGTPHCSRCRIGHGWPGRLWRSCATGQN